MASRTRTKWFQGAQAALAFIGGVFALYTLIDEKILSRPHVTAASSSPLRIKYEPGTRTLTWSFGLILHNDGTKAETIQDARAYLSARNDRAHRHEFNRTYIVLKEGNATVPMNQPLGKDSSKMVTCEISAPLTEDIRKVLVGQRDSRREFQLVLTGSRKDVYPVTFQFDLSPGLLAYVLDARAPSAREVELVGSDLQSPP